MNRRTLLAGASAALPALLAGCLNEANSSDDDGGNTDGNDDTGGDTDGDDDDGDGNDDGDDEDTAPVITGYDVSDRAAEPDAERTSDMDAWGLFVASRDAAEEYYGDPEDDTVATFVEETDFEAGDRLVYLQAYAPQTCYELVLDDDPYVSSNGIPTVEAVVERTAGEDEACGDAMTPVDVLLRIAFDPSAGSTDVLEAEIAGHRDEAEELHLDAER